MRRRRDHGRNPNAFWASVGVVALAIALGVTLALAFSPGSLDDLLGRSSSYSPPPNPTPSPPPLRLVVLGDSIAGGSNEGGVGANGWPAIVAQKLGLTLFLDAEGGTGYTKAGQPGTSAYTARVDAIVALRPDAVIVEGSRNDGADNVATKRAATEVLGRLHSELPQARLLVIGPIYSFPTNVGTTGANDAVKTAAASLGLTYIDTVKAGWFTGSAHSLIGSDGVHPTDAGHLYLANLIAPFVSQLLAQTTPADRHA